MSDFKVDWVDPYPTHRAAKGLNRLDDIVWSGEERHTDSVALQFKDQQWTYEDLADEVRSLAGGLLEHGIGRGDRVVLIDESSPYWLLTYFAIVSVGATAVPLEPERDEDGLRRALRLTEPSAGFISENRISEDHWEELIDGPLIPLSEEGGSLDSFKEERDQEFPLEDLGSEDLASILFTSGTTGHSKGVCLRHKHLLSDVEALYRITPVYESDRFLSLLPMFHAYEFTGGQMLPLYSGASVVYAENLTSKVIMNHFEQDGITLLLGVPLLYQKLHDKISSGLQDAGFLQQLFLKPSLWLAGQENFLGNFISDKILRNLLRKRGFKDLRMLISGGAPLNEEIPQTFRKLGIEMPQGYGLTETSPVITLNPPGSPYPGSVGLSLPGCKVGVLNPDSEGRGEIIVSGDMVFDEYLSKSDENPGDYFHTGDVGRVADGYLFVEGRKKLTVVTAEGKNVFPEHVEEVYRTSPYIDEILVVGDPREDESGDRLKAIVRPDEDYLCEQWDTKDPDEERTTEVIGDELRRLGEHLESHQRVRDYELRWEPFPRTPTEKIKRYLFDESLHHIANEEENEDS